MGVKERFEYYKTCSCPGLTALLLLIILLPMSFHNVEYHEVAFFKRRSTGTIDRDYVYTSGRHCIGPDGSFVKFPASDQTVDFKAMSVWTKTERLSDTTAGAAGTAISLDVTFQYRLRPEELSELYSSVALQYEPFVRNLATTAIKNVSTSFTAEEWTKDRRTIQDALQAGVDTALDAAHADCDTLQLRHIEFPSSFVERMLAAAVQIQTNQAEESLQQSAIIRSTTELGVKRIENDASVVSNTAEAQANLKKIEARQRVQTETNLAEKYTQQATLIRSRTDKEVADINNQATLVLRTAEAEADKLKALAENDLTQTVDSARSEGLKVVAGALNISSQKEKVSLDYIFKLVDSEGGVDTFLGLPADLRTVATSP
mmetsp:Transcript_23896/g.59996  ORF Transcript_23896/g.59996 Transcript_23896/m.59996 type:complete len:374 (+) Transcript_23896:260-1381(+)